MFRDTFGTRMTFLNRFSFSGLSSVIILLLYIPIGITLLSLRIFACLVGAIVLLVVPLGVVEKRKILQLVLSLMGLSIVRSGDFPVIDGPVVCNRVSWIDPFVISTLLDNGDVIRVGREEESRCSEILCCVSKLLGAPREIPLCFPESGVSHCSGISEFEAYRMECLRGRKFHILGIRSFEPWVPVRLSTEGSNVGVDMLYAMFRPLTAFVAYYVGFSEFGETVSPDAVESIRKGISEKTRLPLLGSAQSPDASGCLAKNKPLPKSLFVNGPQFETINNVGPDAYRERKRQLYYAAQRAFADKEPKLQ